MELLLILATAFEAVGKHEAGQMSDEELKDIECNALSLSGGSCSECLQQTL